MVKTQLIKKEVKSGRVGGIVFTNAHAKSNKPLLVLFNQWRSSSKSILSVFMAEMILSEGVFCSVLFLDRIASGGSSDELLTPKEREQMRALGEYQFGEVYAKALERIVNEHNLPRHFSVGGSSAGGPAALACARNFSKQQKKDAISIILVEPSGLRRHGAGKKGFVAVPHALARHVVAYRHRISRGWWTPMDKEQYFTKSGKTFEYRANWWSRDSVFYDLLKALAEPDFPPLTVILSNASHVHTQKTRKDLAGVCVKPHSVVEVTGNHDRICQPPSLSRIYSGMYSA